RRAQHRREHHRAAHSEPPALVLPVYIAARFGWEVSPVGVVGRRPPRAPFLVLPHSPSGAAVATSERAECVSTQRATPTGDTSHPKRAALTVRASSRRRGSPT